MTAIGKEILTSPDFRLDLRHQIIRDRVLKTSSALNYKLMNEIGQINDRIRFQRKNFYNSKLNDDDPDDQTTEALHSARLLEEKLMYDKTCTIEGSLVFNKNLIRYKVK